MRHTSMTWFAAAIRRLVWVALISLMGSIRGGNAHAALPNGVAAGDTTDSTSVLWTRSTISGAVTFEYATDPAFGSILGSSMVMVTDPLQPVKAPIAGLTPGTQYYYRATDAANVGAAGTFRTAAAQGVRTGFRLGVSGDWRGELAPFVGARNAASRDLDLWVSLGDTIYADVASPAVPLPQAMTLDDYRLKHDEVYSARLGLNTLADLRESTSIWAQIDDHEVINDFAGGAPPASDPRFAGQPGTFINESALYQNGLQAFGEYNPLENQIWSGTGDVRLDGKPKLYRSQVYGADAAVFSLDARSFRDVELPAADPLDPASVGAFLAGSFDPSRTMLGRPQVDALKSDLSAAQAAGVTWKFVLVPEPIQNLGVLAAQDRFEGYAAERTEILAFIKNQDIDNVVFVAADIHGTLVNNLTYQTNPLGQQIPVDAFEVTTGSVAYAAPFGPTVAGIAFSLGVPGTLPPAVYEGLTGAQQEGYITGLINAQIAPLGYDPLGLQESGIAATLIAGGYTATNSFGWTEFDIDPQSSALTVTTWGVPWYDAAELATNGAAIASLQPQILSQFIVNPVVVPEPANLLTLISAVIAAIGYRRVSKSAP